MTAVNYLWNPINDNIVEEFDDAGNTIAEYTTEPDLFGDVISQFRDGQESFYHSDGLGSTLALTNVSCDVTDTYAYSAFGGVTARSGSSVNPFQYIGQKGYYRDEETGEYDARQRPLQFKRERWLSQDPWPYLDQVSSTVYGYVWNRPLLFVDPLGLRGYLYGGVYDADSGGGASEPPRISEVPIDPKCKDICGPDVTSWFFDDLLRQVLMFETNVGRLSDLGAGILEPASAAALFKVQAKYFMSYKWMAISAKGCGTGSCANTVELAGVCLPRKQLGNMAFTYVYSMAQKRFITLPPIGMIVSKGYALAPVHTKGIFTGVNRTDNLAAFGVGVGLSKGGKLDKKAFIAELKRLLNDPDIVDMFAKLHPDSPDISPNSLSFTQDFGGFNTRSCSLCPLTWGGNGSIPFMQDLFKQFLKKSGLKDTDPSVWDSFDEFLKAYE